MPNSRGLEQYPESLHFIESCFWILAIIFILQPGIAIMYTGDNKQIIDIAENIWMASLFIGLAAVVDFLDGFVARLFKATSEMGKQLDSLADMVSFGVAPGLIIYQFLRMSYAQEQNGHGYFDDLVITSFIAALCSSLETGKIQPGYNTIFFFQRIAHTCSRYICCFLSADLLECK